MAIAVLINVASEPSGAMTTFCSHPTRERVLARATIDFPEISPRKLERSFDAIAKRIGMSPWGSGLLDSHGKTLRQTVAMQSPKVSVSAEARWEVGQLRVPLVIRRTCINDVLEPWHGYWSNLIREIRKSGDRVTMDELQPAAASR
ncbi:hypothetical protein [Novosphingobium sp. UBA1939]|uniref:hypothetical protein n=1 Tax=Novosphingobium sp. UBA1939 TaxID=1946982 RepID=UPI0025CD8ADB|nr:hypothetical protein [Novosphingobium sp. UBA1939]